MFDLPLDPEPATWVGQCGLCNATFGAMAEDECHIRLANHAINHHYVVGSLNFKVNGRVTNVDRSTTPPTLDTTYEWPPYLDDAEVTHR